MNEEFNTIVPGEFRIAGGGSDVIHNTRIGHVEAARIFHFKANVFLGKAFHDTSGDEGIKIAVGNIRGA